MSNRRTLEYGSQSELPIERRHRAYGALAVFMTGALFASAMWALLNGIGVTSVNPWIGFVVNLVGFVVAGYAAYRLSKGFRDVIKAISWKARLAQGRENE